MVLFFGRKFFAGGRSVEDRRLLERLHGEIVAAVRRPAFYLDMAVPDTFQGRFELLTLHAGLVLRRLNEVDAPGPALAQDLVDLVFQHLDEDLREAGVGDLAVPKRMKKLVEAFLGRSASYAAALDVGDGSLATALARNVCDADGSAPRLAAYAREAWGLLARASLADLLTGPLPFPPLAV